MTLEQLLIFIVAVETLNFSETARRISQSQPSVSQQIKALETELGVPLFERSAKHLSLTPAAESLYPYALRIRQELEAAQSVMSEFRGEAFGRLRIGASTTNGNYLIPQFLAGFKSQYPRIDIHLIVENGANLMAGLYKGNLDIILLEGPKPQELKRYTVESFYQDHLVVVKRPSFKLNLPVKINAMSRYPWVIREPGSGTREILLENLDQYGITLEQLDIRLEVGTVEAVKQVIIHSDTLGYLSKLAIEKEVHAKELQIVNTPELNRPRSLWLIKPEFRYCNAAMKAFLKALKSFCSAI